MDIKMEFEGLEELIKECEKLATEEEIIDTTRKALKKIMPIVESEVKKNYPRSTDPSKSGRKGSRTGEHSVDNIPSKIKKKKGNYQLIVGWEKDDTSPYFYNKFLEWGTSKIRPHKMFSNTYKKQRKEYDDVFKEEFEKLLKDIEEV